MDKVQLNKGNKIATEFENAVAAVKSEGDNLRKVYRDILLTIDCIEEPGTCTKMTIQVQSDKAKKIREINSDDIGAGHYYIKMTRGEIAGSTLTDADDLEFDIRHNLTLIGVLDGSYNITLAGEGKSRAFYIFWKCFLTRNIKRAFNGQY